MLEYWRKRWYVRILRNSLVLPEEAMDSVLCNPVKKLLDHDWNLHGIGGTEFAQFACDNFDAKSGSGKGSSAWRLEMIRNAFTADQMKQLKQLVAADKKGSTLGRCLLFPREVHSKSKNSNSKHSQLPAKTLLLFCCQLWRWPDLDSTKDLVHLPGFCDDGFCGTDLPDANCKMTPQLDCCNPFHWFRCIPEPSKRSIMEPIRNSEECSESKCRRGPMVSERTTASIPVISPCLDEDAETVSVPESAPWPASESRAKRRTGNMTSGQLGLSCDYPECSVFASQPAGSSVPVDSFSDQQWALAYYWEEKRHLATSSPIVDPVFSFSYSPVPDCRSSMHVEQLTKDAQSIISDPHSAKGKNVEDGRVQKREKLIGSGFVLFLDREQRRISIFNRSKKPIFVRTEYLERMFTENCVRIPPGHSLKVFDLDESPKETPAWMTVSLGKGWGETYKCFEQVALPARVEVVISGQLFVRR